MTSRCHICMIAVQHSSKDDRIYFKQAISLNEAGFEVSIVTSNSHGKPMDMSGNFFEAGKDAFGIAHYAIQEPEGLLQRTLKKAFRGKFYRDMIDTAAETGASIFVAHEAQAIPIARKAAEKNGGVYVFDAHESIYVSNPKERLALRTEAHALQYLICANSITLKTIQDKTELKRSEVIYNASVIPTTPVNDNRSPLILHEGSLPFNRGLRLMMKAMISLKEIIPEFKLKIVGQVKGAEKDFFDSIIAEHSLQENITMTGWVDYESLGEAISDGSIGLILNTPEPNNLYGGPANKLFNYMASNMAIVAVNLPETTRILDETGAGITLIERDPRLLAETLASLILDHERLQELRHASHRAHKQYSWQNESKKLIKFYEIIESDLAQGS